MIVRTLEAFLSPKGAHLTFFAQSGLQLPKPDPVRPPIRLTDEDIGEVDRDRVKMIIKNRCTLHTVLFIKVLLEGPCLWYSTTILRTTSQR